MKPKNPVSKPAKNTPTQQTGGEVAHSPLPWRASPTGQLYDANNRALIGVGALNSRWDAAHVRDSVNNTSQELDALRSDYAGKHLRILSLERESATLHAQLGEANAKLAQFAKAGKWADDKLAEYRAQIDTLKGQLQFQTNLAEQRLRANIEAHEKSDAQIARLQQREVELVGALEMFDKCVFPLGAMNHGREAFARRTAALQSVAKPAPIQREQHFIVDKKPEYPCELYSPKYTSWHHFYSFDALSGELDHGWTMWRKSVAKEGEQ